MRIAIPLFFLASITVLCAACSKGGNDAPADNQPVASISNISKNRGTGTTTFSFSVSLDKAAAGAVTIHYTTVAGTAEENKDYKPAVATLTIAAGQKQAAIDVEVTGDSLRKASQEFYLQLDNPQNCKLGSKSKGTATIVNENGLYLPVDNAGYSTPDNYPGYSLAWSDEFDGSSVSSANWSFETGNNNGWGNAELENYTNRTQNAFVSQGNLIIEARQEVYNGSDYTSARMVTKGKRDFTFGRVDIRAKLPKGKGVWPALWMLGSNIDAINWPACGEIDIMELLGQETNKMYGTLHWGSSSSAHASKGTDYILASGSFDEQFHVYSMIWEEDNVKLLVDDTEFFALSKADVAGNDYPFNKDFFFIFNIAVGGNWPGSPDGTTSFPQRMAVDYIRVFQ